ncbi:MAG: YonK family protein [Candidatus Gastranaerophilales bacterium]|nr:YonK family protein [Candidatus Gastranaerophilales bacterium]
MAGSIVKKSSLSAKGILYIENGAVYLENPDTGEAVSMDKLLADFEEKTVSMSVSYNEEFETAVIQENYQEE